MNNVLKLETNKYAIKNGDFEGPLDLLCYLIDKNKMDISEVKIADITDQYLEYIKQSEEQELEVTSEFLIMATTLVLLKSKKLLPVEIEEEDELTEEELLQRIIEYKQYKEVASILKDMYSENKNRLYKMPDKIELKEQKLLDKNDISSARKMLVAAAFTYVASMLSTLLNILRYALIFMDKDK